MQLSKDNRDINMVWTASEEVHLISYGILEVSIGPNNISKTIRLLGLIV